MGYARQTGSTNKARSSPDKRYERTLKLTLQRGGGPRRPGKPSLKRRPGQRQPSDEAAVTRRSGGGMWAGGAAGERA